MHFKVRQTTKFQKVRENVTDLPAPSPTPNRAEKKKKGKIPPRPPSSNKKKHRGDHPYGSAAYPRRLVPLSLPLPRTPRASPPQIFDAFCARKALSADSVRFLFDGSRINPNMTPKDVSVCSSRLC